MTNTVARRSPSSRFLAEVQGNRQVNWVSWDLLWCIQAEFQVIFQGEYGWCRLYE